MAEWITAAAPYATLLVTGVALLLVWQSKVIHKRIDKVGKELDEHVRDGVTVQTDIAGLKKDVEWLKDHNGHKED